MCIRDRTSAAFKKVEEKVREMEDLGPQRATDAGKGKGYIPTKSLVPKAFGSTESDWRKWQDDTADFLDSINAGMRNLLKHIERSEGALDEAWLAAAYDTFPEKLLADENRVNVFRALKTLTEGEARNVVMSVDNENGLKAWKALHTRYGQSLAAMQGRVMCDITRMATRTAKTPADTRTLVTELERRTRLAEEVTGEKVPESLSKSVMVSMLDPLTRAHTTTFHGTKTS